MFVPIPVINSRVDGDYWRPKIDGDCFTSLYLGVNIDNDYKLKIISVARECNPKIQVFQMQTNSNAFKLDSISVNDQ